MKLKKISYLIVFLLIWTVSCEEEEADLNGEGIVNFSSDTLREVENADQAITIYLGLDNFAHGGGTVDVEITGGEYGKDYETSGGSAAFTVEIEPGALTSSFTVIPVDDEVIGDNRELTISLVSATGSLEVGESNSIAFTILENDEPLPTFSSIDFAANEATIDEDGGTLTVDFTLSSELTEESTVEIVANASGTATPAEDFDLNGDTTGIYVMTVPQGATSASMTVNIVDDEAIEEDETIVLEMVNATGNLELGTTTPQQTITIVNNDVEAGVLAYLETFESFDGTETYLNDVLEYQNVLATQTITDPNAVIRLINNGGSFSDSEDVSGTSDNGLNLFYNSQEDPANFGIVDNVLITPILEGSGAIAVSVDAAYAFKNQNSGEVIFYWSETYDGSGTFTESDWNVMGTETVAAMDAEGFGNNAYKREEFTIETTANFYIAIRVNQTIDADNYRTRWRFDNIQANTQ